MSGARCSAGDTGKRRTASGNFPSKSFADAGKIAGGRKIKFRADKNHADGARLPIAGVGGALERERRRRGKKFRRLKDFELDTRAQLLERFSLRRVTPRAHGN